MDAYILNNILYKQMYIWYDIMHQPCKLYIDHVYTYIQTWLNGMCILYTLWICAYVLMTRICKYKCKYNCQTSVSTTNMFLEHVSVSKYTYLEPKWPLCWLEWALFWRVEAKGKQVPSTVYTNKDKINNIYISTLRIKRKDATILISKFKTYDHPSCNHD